MQNKGRKPGTPPGFRAVVFLFTGQHSTERHVPKGTSPGFRAISSSFKQRRLESRGNSIHLTMRRRYQKRSTPSTMDESNPNSSLYARNVCDRPNNERGRLNLNKDSF